MTETAPAAPAARTVQMSWGRFLPAVMFLVALGLRLMGIGWGLPNDLHNQSYHPDEQIVWLYSQQIEPTQGKFTPGFYNYGTLYLTVLRVASDVVAGYGAGPKPNDPQSEWRYMGACHLAGRWISAVAGSVAVLFVFLILRRYCHLFGASAGALLLAFAPSFMVHSRFQTVDVLATMLLTVSLWQCCRVLDDPNPARCAIWAGVFAGLSAGTKYTGALALIPIGLAMWMRWKSGEVKAGEGEALASRFQPLQGLLPGIVFLLAFVIGTPGSILETDKFLRDFKFEMLHTSTGHGLVFEGVGSGFFFHLGNLSQGLGPIALILGLIGVGWAAWSRQRWMLVGTAFALPYYVLIGRAEVHFVRYTFPLLVILALGFGWLVGNAHERRGKQLGWAALGILGLGMALQVAMGYTSWMSQPDPRDQIARVLRAESTETTTIGLVKDPWFYSPPLIPDSTIMRGQLKLQVDEMAVSSKPRVVRYLPEDPRERQDWDIRLLTEVKPDYIVFSNLEAAHVVRLSETEGVYPEVDQFKKFISELEARYTLVSGPAVDASKPIRQRYAVATLLVEDMAYTRPLLWLWKRKP